MEPIKALQLLQSLTSEVIKYLTINSCHFLFVLPLNLLTLVFDSNIHKNILKDLKRLSILCLLYAFNNREAEFKYFLQIDLRFQQAYINSFDLIYLGKDLLMRQNQTTGTYAIITTYYSYIRNSIHILC